jgi:cytochrome c553
MYRSLLSTVFSAVAIVAVVAVPANSAEEIEAKVQLCSSCHGENGVPIDTTTPVIWGQQQSYLVKQIHDYKSRDRENPIMEAMADTIKQDEIRKVAAYFASKNWPARRTAVADATPPSGIAICRACHQPNFEGGPPAPRLAGLSYEYLVGAMQSFADDGRTNNLDMPKLMKALSESERDAIARYLSGL